MKQLIFSKVLTPLVITTLGLVLIGCSPKADSESKSSTSQQAITSDPLAEIWMEHQPEGNVITVSSAMGSSQGDSVLVEGVIGGVLHPFSDDYAVLVVADDAIVFCNEMGDDDHCSTPWDACCEDPGKLKASRASIQVVGADGFTLSHSFKGFNNLKELDTIIIQGMVAPSSTDDNLIIHATGIHLAKPFGV